MKKSILALAALFVIGTACKKEETGGGTETPKSTEEKIIGAWKGDKQIEDVNISGTGFFDTVYVNEMDMSGFNLEFKSDGTVVADSLGLNPDVSNWELLSDNLIKIEDQEFDIILLNDANFHIQLDSSYMVPPINFSIKNIIQLKK